ncbi:MAG: type I phosphomannose isomerase catalytic subunit [Bryobacteraceae bacterium]
MMRLWNIEPVFQERVWGSTKLGPWFANSSTKIGEVWFEEADLPVLIKFLYTNENLSVQVHPDDAYARKHHDSPGKTEMWHVLAAEPGAKIAAGFREPVTREQMKAAALTGEIMNLLEWFDASVGDTFFIPAGTVHAIGAGLTICEVQQKSDVTYRIFDYGRDRELHVDHALNVSKLERAQPRASMPVTCPFFAANHLTTEGYSTQLRTAPYQTLVILGGEGKIGGHDVKAGQVWRYANTFLPIPTTAGLDILHVCRPHPEDDSD